MTEQAVSLEDRACSCDGCWACTGHVKGCTCDVDWDALYEKRFYDWPTEDPELCSCGGVLCDTCGKCENGSPYRKGCADCDD